MLCSQIKQLKGLFKSTLKMLNKKNIPVLIQNIKINSKGTIKLIFYIICHEQLLFKLF